MAPLSAVGGRYAGALATIREAAMGPVTPALFATVDVDDDVERGRRALDEYCRATYRTPLDSVERIQAMLTGPDLPAQIRRFADAGARHVLIRIAAVRSGDYARQRERVAGLLSALPAVGGGSPAGESR